MKRTLLLIIVAVIIFLFFAFIECTFNVKCWGIETRAMCGFFAAIPLCAACIFPLIEKDNW
jgi:hypothetical protein